MALGCPEGSLRGELPCVDLVDGGVFTPVRMRDSDVRTWPVWVGKAHYRFPCKLPQVAISSAPKLRAYEPFPVQVLPEPLSLDSAGRQAADDLIL